MDPTFNGIGDARKKHPISMRLRSAQMPREIGGAKGWRGSNWRKQKDRARWLAKERSTVTGLPPSEVENTVDHIIPYRISGVSPQTNTQKNLRVTDRVNNLYVDYIESGKEKPRRRSLKGF